MTEQECGIVGQCIELLQGVGQLAGRIAQLRVRVAAKCGQFVNDGTTGTDFEIDTETSCFAARRIPGGGGRGVGEGFGIAAH